MRKGIKVVGLIVKVVGLIVGALMTSLTLGGPVANAAEGQPGAFVCRSGVYIYDTFVGRSTNLDQAVHDARIQTQGWYIDHETATQYWNGWEVDDYTIHCG